MSRKYRNSICIVTALALAGCGGSRGRASPEDPFAATPEAPLPVAAMAGRPVLLLSLGAVVGDTGRAVRELELGRAALLEYANAALDTALRRDARGVLWHGLAEQRRAARGAPTLGLQPDNLFTAPLADRRVEQVPDPLRSQLRSLAALTGARTAVVPVALRVRAAGEALVATFLLVAVDARLGTVLWRGSVSGGPAGSVEAAIASAAGSVVAR